MKRMLKGALGMALLAGALFFAPAWMAGMAGLNYGTAYAVARALPQGPLANEGGTLAALGVAQGFDDAAVTQPTNPSQASSGFALGQSAIVVYQNSGITPAAVNANTTAEQDFTVTGILAGSLVVAIKPTSQAGLGVCTARVKSANTVSVTFCNPTAGNITPTATQGWLFIEIRGPLIQTAALTAANGAAPAAVATLTTSVQTFNLAALVAAGQQGLSSAKIATQPPVVSVASPAGVPLGFTAPVSASAVAQQATVTGPSPVFVGTPQTVLVNKPTAQAGLGIVNARIADNNLLELTYCNTSGAPITPTAETVSFFACRGMALHESSVHYLVNVGAAAATTATDTKPYSLTVKGVAVGDTVVGINKPSDQAHIGGFSARVSAADTIVLTIVNPNAGAATPTASEVWDFVVDKINTGHPFVLQQISALLAQAAWSTPNPSIAAITSVELTIPVTGLLSGNALFANFDASALGFLAALGGGLPPGLGIGGVRISAGGTLAVTLVNVTAAAIVLPALRVTAMQAPTGISGDTAGAAGSAVVYGYDVQDQQAFEQQYQVAQAAIARGLIKGA